MQNYKRMIWKLRITCVEDAIQKGLLEIEHSAYAFEVVESFAVRQQ